MTWKKLTASDKRKITNDWNNCFPSLGVYKPMHLLSRVGPLLIGIILHVKSGQTDYIPTFHVHNLAQGTDFISLGMKTTIRREYVFLAWHEKRYQLLAEKLRKLAPIPIEGEVTLRDVLNGYKSHFSKTEYIMPYYIPDLEDMVMTCVWCNDFTKKENSIRFIIEMIKKWPADITERRGGLEKIINDIEDKCADSDKLRKTVENSAKILKVEKLPIRKLIC